MTGEPVGNVAVEPTVEAVPVLAYASEVGVPTGLRPGLQDLQWVAIGSGLCVLSCFAIVWTEAATWSVLAHVVLYILMLVKAIRTGATLMASDVAALRSTARTTLDLVAGLGLVIIGVAPVAIASRAGYVDRLAPILGLAFGLMAVTTWRHWMLYAPLGQVFRAAGCRKLGQTFVILGWIKFAYEALWLMCCAAPLLSPAFLRRTNDDLLIYLAFGALFGCIGYGVIWIVMMIAHVRAVVVARRWERGHR